MSISRRNFPGTAALGGWLPEIRYSMSLPVAATVIGMPKAEYPEPNVFQLYVVA
jgi:hypothetical protein